MELLAQYKPGRQLQTNVEFYTALLLHGLGFAAALREAGLPAELVEPALARLAEAEAGLSKEDLGLLGDFKGMMKMQGVGHPARK